MYNVHVSQLLDLQAVLHVNTTSQISLLLRRTSQLAQREWRVGRASALTPTSIHEDRVAAWLDFGRR